MRIKTLTSYIRTPVYCPRRPARSPPHSSFHPPSAPSVPSSLLRLLIPFAGRWLWHRSFTGFCHSHHHPEVPVSCLYHYNIWVSQFVWDRFNAPIPGFRWDWTAFRYSSSHFSSYHDDVRRADSKPSTRNWKKLAARSSHPHSIPTEPSSISHFGVWLAV